MSTEPAPTPIPGPGPGGIHDVHSAAAALGLTVSTMRLYVHQKPTWLAPPTGFGNKNTWSAEQVGQMAAARAELAAQPRKRKPRTPKPTSPLTSPARLVTVTIPSGEADDGFWE